MSKFISKHGIIFDAIWSEFLDEQFFSLMQTEAIFHKRCITRDDTPILSSVTDWMNVYGSTTFTLEDIVERFDLAHIKWHTWKALTNHSCIQYDDESLSIITTPAVWDIIYKEFALGIHYRNYPMERMWHEMNSLFGPDEARRSTYIANLPPKPTRLFPIKVDPLPTLPISKLPSIDEILEDYAREEAEWKLKRERTSKAKKSPPTNHYPFDRVSSTKGKWCIIQRYGQHSSSNASEGNGDVASTNDESAQNTNVEISQGYVWPNRNAKRHLGL